MKTFLAACWITLVGLLALPAPAGAADEIGKEIERSGVLRVCQASDEPWSFINPATGKWDGLTQDMAAKLAEALGVKLEVIDAGWAALIQNLSSGKCHLSVAATFATVKRSQVVLFSRPFAHEGQTAIVKKDSKVNGYKDLDQAGKVILSTAGAATTEFAKRYFKRAEVKAIASDSKLQAMVDVQAGRADASWVAYVANVRFLRENPQLGVRFIDADPIGFSAIRWAIPAGEYHFQQVVNNWLAQFIDSGEMEALWKKWFPDAAYLRGND